MHAGRCTYFGAASVSSLTAAAAEEPCGSKVCNRAHERQEESGSESGEARLHFDPGLLLPCSSLAQDSEHHEDECVMMRRHASSQGGL